MKTSPIGIFDSGVGGLTVVRALIKRLPRESFIYYGDTAHVPYGSKSKEQLFKYAGDIISFLLDRKVKTIVVACGTHSSVTLPEMESTSLVPLLGVVKPGARAAVRTSQNGKIGVIATQASINSRAYNTNINMLAPAYQVFGAACARFVPLVEEGCLVGDETRQAVREYIGPLINMGIDTLVMGCTHYPFLASVISECTGKEVTLVDPAIETIDELARILESRNLLNDTHVKGRGDFYVSGDEESFYKVGRMLLGDVIQKVEKFALD